MMSCFISIVYSVSFLRESQPSLLIPGILLLTHEVKILETEK